MFDELYAAILWQAFYQDDSAERRGEGKPPYSRKRFVQRTLVFLRQGVREETDALMDAAPASRARH